MNMKKLVFGEELRAIFRELFKIEVKDIAKDVAFLGKLGETKINSERLSLDERRWLQNLGLLTRDSKNAVDVDDRTIFSHVISAVYAGLYGLNFVDVTSHCLETIKTRKGLKPNQNLVDFMSPQELRQFAIALYTLSNEIRQLKNAGKLKYATMSNFYYVADKAFTAGLNARRHAVLNTNTEFDTRETTSKHSAENTLNNIDAAIIDGTFSHKTVQYPNCDAENLRLQKNLYIGTEQQIQRLLERNGFDNNQINKIIASIDEGFYKTKYFRTHNKSISNLIAREDSVMSTMDIESQNLKILYAKITLSNYLKRTAGKIRRVEDVQNVAYKSGSHARLDCACNNQTSPEYFSSFISALILDKEEKFNPVLLVNKKNLFKF